MNEDKIQIEIKILHDLQEFGVVQKNIFCENSKKGKCKNIKPLKLSCRKRCTQSTSVLLTFRCTSGRRYHSPFTNTFISLFRVSPFVLMLFIKYWAAQVSIKKGICLAEMDNEKTICKETVIKLYQKLRNVCTRDLNKATIKLGGKGKSVEIDESLVAKVKHNVGKDLARPQIWVFGFVERIRDLVYLSIVPDRTAFTLLQIIYDHVLNGSTIYSDSWSSYSKISEIGEFQHKTVNHSYNFVDPNEPRTHTQRIESLWRNLKSKFKEMYGCDRLYLQSYCDEYMWRHNNKLSREDSFKEILKAIGRIYPPGSMTDILDIDFAIPDAHEGN